MGLQRACAELGCSLQVSILPMKKACAIQMVPRQPSLVSKWPHTRVAEPFIHITSGGLCALSVAMVGYDYCGVQ